MVSYTHKENFLDHSHENNRFDFPSHLNESYIISIIELFPYRDTSNHSCCLSIVFAGQSKVLVPCVPQFVKLDDVFVTKLHHMLCFCRSI